MGKLIILLYSILLKIVKSFIDQWFPDHLADFYTYLILLANVLQAILHKVLLITEVKIFRHCITNNFSKDYFRQQYQRSCHQVQSSLKPLPHKHFKITFSRLIPQPLKFSCRKLCIPNSILNIGMT